MCSLDQVHDSPGDLAVDLGRGMEAVVVKVLLRVRAHRLVVVAHTSLHRLRDTQPVQLPGRSQLPEELEQIQHFKIDATTVMASFRSAKLVSQLPDQPFVLCMLLGGNRGVLGRHGRVGAEVRHQTIVEVLDNQEILGARGNELADTALEICEDDLGVDIRAEDKVVSLEIDGKEGPGQGGARFGGGVVGLDLLDESRYGQGGIRATFACR